MSSLAPDCRSGQSASRSSFTNLSNTSEHISGQNLNAVALGRAVTSVERLSGGLSNSSFKIQFESSNEPIVLRLYEREPIGCCKELELLAAVSPTIPVPEVLHAEPNGDHPFMFLRYVDGITFRDLKRSRDKRAIQEAAYSIGAVLATIGKQNVSHLALVKSGPGSMLEDFEKYFRCSRLRARTGPMVARQLVTVIDDWSTRLKQTENEGQLVHGDFRKQNVLVRFDGSCWNVAAILDWECAFLGSPLIDVGMFLRYEQPENPVAEPAFSRGYRIAAGDLPDDWFGLSRVLDLHSLCSSLSSPDLPLDIEREIVGLVTRTIKELESTCV